MSWSFGLDLGSALGGLIGAGASMISSKRQMHYQSALQREAAALNYDYGIKSLENSPTAQRKGLVSAGYNPMLAVSNATYGANSGWTSTGQAGSFDASIGLSSGLNNVLSVQNMKNQTSQTESINDKNYAEADEAKVRKQSMLQKLPFISQREKAEIGNIEKDSILKEAQVHNLEETTRFIEKDFELRKRLGEMGIDVQRYGIDKNLAGVVYNANTNERMNKLTNEINEVNNIRSNNTNRQKKSWSGLGFGHSGYYD